MDARQQTGEKARVPVVREDQHQIGAHRPDRRQRLVQLRARRPHPRRRDPAFGQPLLIAAVLFAGPRNNGFRLTHPRIGAIALKPAQQGARGNDCALVHGQAGHLAGRAESNRRHLRLASPAERKIEGSLHRP